MRQPACDVCGQPATLHETAVENATAVTRHFCEEHGQAVWQAAAPLGDAAAQSAALQAAEEHWRSLSEGEKEWLAQLYRQAMSEVLAGLRFPDPDLRTLLGGEKAVVESPLLREVFAHGFHEGILEVLNERFGTVPDNHTKLLRGVLDEKKLKQLTVFAWKCPDLDAFREALLK